MQQRGRDVCLCKSLGGNTLTDVTSTIALPLRICMSCVHPLIEFSRCLVATACTALNMPRSITHWRLNDTAAGQVLTWILLAAARARRSSLRAAMPL